MPKGKYIKTEEHRNKISESMKEHYKKRYGTWHNRELSEDHKENISKSMKEHFSENGPNRWKPETKKRRSKEIRGKNNPNWKPEVNTELHKRVMGSYLGRQWKSDVLTRDQHTCMVCGVNESYMATHHKIPIKDILDKYEIDTIEEALECKELWNINNGVTLCCSCHSKAEAKIKKCEKVGESYPKWIKDLVETPDLEETVKTSENKGISNVYSSSRNDKPDPKKPKGKINSDY